MANTAGYVTGGIQLVIGIVLTVVGRGFSQMGYQLIVSGALTIAAAGASDLLAPRPSGGDGGFGSSATYGFDTIQNAAFEGSPRWFVLGEEHQVAPTYISAHTEQAGSKQTLHALLYCGSGGRYGVESIDNVKLNEQDAEYFSSVKVRKRYGTSDQAVIDGFEKTSIPHAIDHLFSDGNYTTTYATKGEVHEVGLLFAWRGGMYHARSNGHFKPEVWGCTIYTREYDSGDDWEKYRCPNTDADDWVASSTGDWQIVERSLAQFYRMAILKFGSTAKRYEIKVVAFTGYANNLPRIVREPTLIRVEEREQDNRTYAGSVLIGIEAVASGALRGGLPKITCEVSGWKVENKFAGSEAHTSANPVDCVREFMLNDDDGCGSWITTADLDDGAGGSWETAHTYFDTNAASSGEHKEARHKLDLVVDSLQPAHDWLEHIMSTCRSALVEVGGTIYWYIDKAASSIRTFDARQTRDAANRPILAREGGVADILEVEVESDRRATHVKAQYWDKADDYTRRWTEELVDPDWSDGDPIIREELFLPGVTRATQALRETRYRINRSRLRTRVVEFGVGIGDLDLLPMDIITVYADYPAYDGKLFQVLTAVKKTRHDGRVVALEYDADAYTDTTDKLPAKEPSLSRADALKKARKIPRGATNVKLTPIKVA